MRQRPFHVACALVAVTLLGGLTPIAAQNPITAARDAFRKAQEEARRKQQQTPPPQPATPPAGASTVPGTNAASPHVLPAADYAKLVASVGFTDVVGVKLGMTPDQAFAAITAANPKLTIDVLRVDLQVGSRSVPTPKWAYAHGPRRGPSTFNPDGSGESIGLEFSLPPNPPVVIRIARLVRFADALRVAQSTMLDALRTKYGTENVPVPSGSDRMGWLFERTGVLARGPLVLTRAPGWCSSLADPPFPFPLEGAPEDTNTPKLWSAVNEITTRYGSNLDYDVSAERCTLVGPTVTVVGVGAGLNPKDLAYGFSVELRSGALAFHSVAATNAFLKKAIEDEIKQEQDAGAKRAAPKV